MKNTSCSNTTSYFVQITKVQKNPPCRYYSRNSPSYGFQLYNTTQYTWFSYKTLHHTSYSTTKHSPVHLIQLQNTPPYILFNYKTLHRTSYSAIKHSTVHLIQLQNTLPYILFNYKFLDNSYLHTCCTNKSANMGFIDFNFSIDNIISWLKQRINPYQNTDKTQQYSDRYVSCCY